jgi:GNAT superfamily N-acetyltransferase
VANVAHGRVDSMRVDARLYREAESPELDEWERLVGNSPAEARLGSDLRWADLDPETDFLIRLWDTSQLRACAWVTRRTVRVSGREVPVAGIRGVVTDPDHRRRGYGRAVMERAHELMRSFADCEFALLFSSVMAVPFYEDLSWRTISGPVLCDQPEGVTNYTESLPSAAVMALGLRLPVDLPSGTVDVHGLPW